MTRARRRALLALGLVGGGLAVALRPIAAARLAARAGRELGVEFANPSLHFGFAAREIELHADLFWKRAASELRVERAVLALPALSMLGGAPAPEARLAVAGGSFRAPLAPSSRG